MNHMNLIELKRKYTETLLNEVMPFWMKDKIDQTKGCLHNCVDDQGNILSKNRFIWSQGRALWTFSALYNKIEKREEWLIMAHQLFHYLVNNGRDEDGKWMFLLDEEDNVIERDTSICVDGFVMSGLCEYYLATGNKQAATIAVETFENTYRRLQNPGSYQIEPYQIPEGMKIQGINMMFSMIYFTLGEVLKRKDILQAGYQMAKEVLSDFYDSDRNAILEFVNIDGSKSDSAKGRVCIPGHVIECMWFLISIFEKTGDQELIEKCSRLILRHIQLGWDHEYGGIQLALDIDGKEPVAWHKHTCKPWWVQVEALVATIYAYKHTKEEAFLIWHKKIMEYAYANYPSEYGEWTQWLDRYGNKGDTAALPVKDPYHLPRGLIYLITLLNNI